MRKQDDLNPKTDYLQKLGYETTDVALNVLVRWGGYLFIFIAIMSIASFAVYKVFAPSVPEPVNIATRPKLPRGESPVLQPLPFRDMKDFRREEETRLTKYGWVDKNAGIVHIPVDRAIDLVAERGEVPKQAPPGPDVVQPGANVNPDAGTVGTNEPGSTRPEFPAPGEPPGPKPGAPYQPENPAGTSGETGGRPSIPTLPGHSTESGRP
jgi:hypothetical protein